MVKALSAGQTTNFVLKWKFNLREKKKVLKSDKMLQNFVGGKYLLENRFVSFSDQI